MATGRAVFDEIDFRILGFLIENGRASFAELGKAVSLSPHAAADRVRRLRRLGAIRRFTAELDLAAVGRGLDAFIDIRLLPSTDPDGFELQALGLPSVREVCFVTGRWDYQVRVACANADELDSVLRKLRAEAGAAVTETRIVLRRGQDVPLRS